MNLRSIVLLSAIAIGSTQCKKGNGGGTEQPGNDTVSRFAPVETAPPNTNYPSAFEGQTRIYGIKTFTPLKVEVLTSSLSNPWGIEVLPDGRFLITQKAGTLAIVSATGTIENTIPVSPAVANAGQGGLLDVALDPNFSQNRMIYWSFSQPVSGGNLTAIAKGKLATDWNSIENASVIFQATPSYNGSLHFGGRMLFDNQGNLLLGTGERSDLVTRPQAQELNSHLGKILRIKTDGTPATGNPFLNTNGAMKAIYSYGHRNVQGLAIDRVNNVLWAAEFGPLGGDEVNIVEAGKNYGWPVITYGKEYSGATIGSGITQQNGMEQPRYYWDPVVSPSGMIFYTSSQIPEWQNNLLIGALSGTHIVRLRILNNKIAGEERLLQSEGQRFRDLAQDNMGNVYAITDQGRLYKISKL
ncbi:PQQ-dependent sugar dehydrogenase [Edaphocola flava]|uniref:PQQ-dependent sugar dehydrogenase n=1 Tax=Edaphocola flava TaxID=2499629 RepID=UPI00100B1050|nr:PQQ-dependent sugar dehydrogenase [Edaphocola flava]